MKLNQHQILEGFLTVREVADLLHLSRSSVYQLMQKGALPWIQIGRARRIPRAAIVDLAANCFYGANFEEGNR